MPKDGGAVLYEHEIHHMNEMSASRRPNFVGRAAGEAHEFFSRISRAGLGPETQTLLRVRAFKENP